MIPGRLAADRPRRDDGSITLFVTLMMTALLMFAGLVIDLGYAIAAKRRAMNVAEQAARQGGQALQRQSLRGGGVTVDADAGTRAARRYLADAGYTGRADVHGSTITVTVTVTYRTTLLGIAGVRSLTMTASGTADGVRGITEAESG